MKQTIIAVICFLCVSSLYIQAQKINHPSLLYTPQRIQQVKKRMQHEPKLQEAWGDIKKTADEALQKKDFNRLDYLSLAYLMTDNKEYADVIKEILLKAVEAESWGDVEMMARIPAWRSDRQCTAPSPRRWGCHRCRSCPFRSGGREGPGDPRNPPA